MKNVYIFGAGGAATWVCSGFEKAGINVVGIIDDNADSIRNLGGFSVLRADEVQEELKEYPIVVSIMNPKVRESEIISRLRNYGWKNPINYGDFCINFLRESGYSPCMIDTKKFKENLADYQKTIRIYNDPLSKKIHQGLIEFFINGISDEMGPISEYPYFPSDLPRYCESLRFIDCGAFNGDTIRSALDRGYQIDSAYAFEPDSMNYIKLVEYAKGSKLNLVCAPLALSDESKTIMFSSQGGSGSSIYGNPDSYVQCVSLDQMLFGYKPNLIKMDIEGAEYSTLLGAHDLLKSNLPDLAISIYHKADDFWRIPEYIYNIYGDDAKYFLRRHSNYSADIVLYVFKK